VTQVNGDQASGATDVIAAFAYDLERGDTAAHSRAIGRLQNLRSRLPEAIEAIKESDAKRASRQQPLPHPLSAYAGSYRHDLYGTFTFMERDGVLHWTLGALSGRAEVLDAGQNALRIIVVDGGSSVTFAFPSGATVAQSLEFRDDMFVRQ
jgi:hypothetical protein